MHVARWKRRAIRWALQLCIAHSAINLGLVAHRVANGEEPTKQLTERDVNYPPSLPGGVTIATDTSPEFLRRPPSLREGVAVAQTPPAVNFMYYPGQNYPGKPWSNWGDGLAVNGRYYSAIGDHLTIQANDEGDDEHLAGAHGAGNAFVFEYDPDSKSLRQLVNVANVLKRPDGHYTPGKIHSRIDIGSDGWLYYATHRGSVNSAADKFHYRGDWILRTDPESARTEVVVQGPVAKHSTPNSVLDPHRMIFYGGTAAGPDAADKGIWFYAYDINRRKLLYSGPNGPARAMIFAPSTGRVYYVAGTGEGPLMRFDPQKPETPKVVEGATMGIRAATQETPDGYVYAVSSGQEAADSNLWSFNTKTEEVKKVGTAAVGTQAYITSIDVDATGRYLYYVPGAHGSGEQDGTPIVQFDVKSGRKKVIAFLHPFYERKYGCTLRGTYATAVDPAGDKLYVTWNVSRNTRAWDCCGLTVIHVPESERP